MSTTRLGSQKEVSTFVHTASPDSKIIVEGSQRLRVVALERTFLSVGLEPTSYSQFRGVGSPSADLGRPGDIFIDLSPKAYRAFIRYETWREWPGIYREIGTGSDPPGSKFTHPADSTRIMWCTVTDVMWYKNDSIRRGRKRLFASYPHSSFVSAHELISRSAISRDGMQVGQKRLPYNNPESFKKRKVETGSVLSDSRAEDVDSGSSLVPNASHRSLHTQSEGVHDSATPTQNDPNPRSDVTRMSVCPTDQEIRTTHALSDPIQIDGYCGKGLRVISHRREFQAQNGSTIQYTQFRDYGSPPSDLGKPGDMFLDMSPKTHRLFVRYTAWREWPGVYLQPTDNRFLHPDDRTRVVWCSSSDLSWYRTVSLSKARTRLFRSTPGSFVPAHRLILRSGILRQKIDATERSDLDTSHAVGDEGGEASVSGEASFGPLSRGGVDSTNSHGLTSNSTMVVQTPTKDTSASGLIGCTLKAGTDSTPAAINPRSRSLGPDGDNLLRSLSRLSSVLSSIPSPDNQTPPLTSPLLELSPARWPTPKPEGCTGLDEAEEVVVVEPGREATENVGVLARNSQRIQDHYMKRKEKYLRQRDELLKKVEALSREEEMTADEEERARKRLEDAKQDALRRKEQIRRQKEELDRERAEISSMEKEVFRREHALKQQQEVIRRIEETIAQWDLV